MLLTGFCCRLRGSRRRFASFLGLLDFWHIKANFQWYIQWWKRTSDPAQRRVDLLEHHSRITMLIVSQHEEAADVYMTLSSGQRFSSIVSTLEQPSPSCTPTVCYTKLYHDCKIIPVIGGHRDLSSHNIEQLFDLLGKGNSVVI